MNATAVTVLAFAGILGASLLGMLLKRVLPEAHLTPETKDTVRVAMALVATMTALLLGLLIASAKGSYDSQRGQVILLAGKLGYLDRVLTVYGPETAEVRTTLHRGTKELIGKLWPDGRSPADPADIAVSGGEALFISVHQLAPQTDEQRVLKGEATDTVTEIAKTRWLLVAQSDSSIPKPLLIMVIVWLCVISLSFGLFAPANKTVVVAMTIISLLVSSALFLILELDRPFDGVIQVSNSRLLGAVGDPGQ